MSEETKEQEKTEEKKEEEEKKETNEQEDALPNLQAQIPAMLKAHPRGPSPGQIESWKAEYGEVFVSGFSEDELFVWRTLTRGEWTKLQELASDPKNQIDALRFEEMVCQTAVLWASMENPWQVKAGNASTVHEQILGRSNFYSPQAASYLVVKL